MPIALLLVDALSPVYIAAGALPTVTRIGQSGFSGSLKNIYAYRGIEATLFTGCMPDEHGIWGEFRPARPPTPATLRDALLRLLIRIGDTLPSDRLRLDVRYVANWLLRPGRPAMGHLIPADLLSAFQSSTEAPLWEPGSVGTARTIFDELRTAGQAAQVVMHPLVRNDHEISPAVATRCTRGELPPFWYIKFSALDALGHTYGPDLERLAPALMTLDTQIQQTIESLRSAYHGNIDIVVVSDHGMSQVGQTLDVRPALRATGLRPGREFLFFLDSTTVRIWSADLDIRSQLTAALTALPGLQLLDAHRRAELRIPNDDGTGDMLFAIDEGGVVFPDFFRRARAPRGMHGYAHVLSEAGLPYLAAEPPLAQLLAPRPHLGHADLWAAMRVRLGLHTSANEEPACTSWR